MTRYIDRDGRVHERIDRRRREYRDLGGWMEVDLYDGRYWISGRDDDGYYDDGLVATVEQIEALAAMMREDQRVVD